METTGNICTIIREIGFPRLTLSPSGTATDLLRRPPSSQRLRKQLLDLAPQSLSAVNLMAITGKLALNSGVNVKAFVVDDFISGIVTAQLPPATLHLQHSFLLPPRPLLLLKPAWDQAQPNLLAASHTETTGKTHDMKTFSNTRFNNANAYHLGTATDLLRLLMSP